jgi:hypothetical protein
MLEEERAQRAAAARRASNPQGNKPRSGSTAQQPAGRQPSKRTSPPQPPAEAAVQSVQPEPEQQPVQPQSQPTPPDSLSFDAGGSGSAQPLDSGGADDSAGRDDGEGDVSLAVDRTELELIDDEKLRRASNVARRVSESSAPQRPFHMQQAEQQAGRPMPRCPFTDCTCI